MRLQLYDYEIIHQKGKDNVVADMLSRSVPVVDSLGKREEGRAGSTDKWLDGMVDRVPEFPGKYPEWRLEEGKLFKFLPPRFPKLEEETACWREITAKSPRATIVQEFHDPPTIDHLGISNTIDRVQRRFYWPKMKGDIVSFVRCCKTCLGTKMEQNSPKELMGKHPAARCPWHIISTDLFGTLPRSSKGFTFILVVTDYFSKFNLFFPLRQATATAIAEIIEKCFSFVRSTTDRVVR